jgi:hypothetical protein
VVVTGHHPERFPWVGERLGDPGSSYRGLLFRLTYRLSSLIGLGDTFEVYAVKPGGRR